MLVIVVIANVCLLYGCLKVSKLLHMHIQYYIYIHLFVYDVSNKYHIHSTCIKIINVVKLNQTCHLSTENSIRNGGWVYEIQVEYLHTYTYTYVYSIYHSLKSYLSLPHLRSVSKHTVVLRGFSCTYYAYIIWNLNHLNQTMIVSLWSHWFYDICVNLNLNI